MVSSGSGADVRDEASAAQASPSRAAPTAATVTMTPYGPLLRPVKSPTKAARLLALSPQGKLSALNESSKARLESDRARETLNSAGGFPRNRLVDRLYAGAPSWARFPSSRSAPP
jgi:hypothetical protein